MQAREPYNHRWLILLMVALFWGFGLTQAWSGGMSWGPTFEDAAAESCSIEDEPTIVAGPLRSPMRIVEEREGTLLVSDRSGSIYRISTGDPANPVLLFQIKGNPLGVASLGSSVLVGNERTGKVEVYRRGLGQMKKRKSFPKGGGLQPLDIAVDADKGMIFVVDGLGRDVKVFNLRGKLVQSIGGFGQLSQPQALSLDPLAEQLFVTDYGDPRVGISASLQVFDYSGRYLKTISGAFSRPQGVWTSGDSIYLVDALLGQILELKRESGEKIATHGCYGVSTGHLLLPMDVVYDSATQQLFVADNRNGRVTTLTVAQP